MLALHPEILSKNGKKQFVILPYEEFVALQEELSAAADLRDLRKAQRKEGRKPIVSITEAKRRLGIKK